MLGSFIQLGIGGAALFVLYQLAKLAIKSWSTNDEAKTKVISDGFKSITDSHAAMVRDNLNGYNATVSLLHDHHSKVAGQIGNVRDLVIAVDAKVSAAMDLTPIRQQRPDLMAPIDKTLVATNYLQPAQPAPPASEPQDSEEVTPPMGPPPQPQRAYNRPPTPVPLPPAERPNTPTSRAQSVPRPISGEYSGTVKKPR